MKSLIKYSSKRPLQVEYNSLKGALKQLDWMAAFLYMCINSFQIETA